MTDWRERHRRRVAELEAAATEVILTALGSILDDVAARFAAVTAAAEEEARANLDALAAIGAQWRTAVDLAVIPWFGQVFEAGAAAAAEQISDLGLTVGLADPDLMDHAARQYLAQTQARFYGLGDQAWAAARAELVAGFEAGEGIGALRRRITEVTALSRAQAETLARTEVIGASNMGAAARVDLMGADAPPFKQWLSTLDARTRLTHVAADGQVVPRGERFQVGAAQMKVPGDPAGPDQEVMNCRCTVLWLDTADRLDLEGRQTGGTPAGALPLAAATGPRQIDSTTGEEHTGAMVALVPADPDAWALTGGEPAEALHVTLGYLGDAADIPIENQALLVDAVQTMVAHQPPLEAKVFGAAVWNTTGDDPCVVLQIGGEGLEPVHAAAWEAIDMAVRDAWPGPPAQHAPWVAHMCLAYVEDPSVWMDEATALEGPILFDRVRLTFGGEAHDFPLTGSPPAAAQPEGGTMPWDVRPAGDDCPFEVFNTETDERVACHDTEDAARQQVEALYANEPDAAVDPDPTESEPVSGRPAPDPMPGEHLRVVMHVPGVPTGARDTGRVFVNMDYRDPPFAYHWDRTSSAHGGMPTVVHVGNVVRVEPGGADGTPDYGFVTLDLASEDGREYARRVVAGFARWVSIGGDETQAEITLVYPEDQEPDPDDPFAMAEPSQIIFDGVRVGELTAVSNPAQADATVEPTEELIAAMQDTAPTEEDPLVAAARRRPAPVPLAASAGSCNCGDTCGHCGEPTVADVVQAVTAAAYTITIPELPPAAWFQEPTDVTMDGAFCVTDEGRIYGLLAPLGTGHRAWAKSGGRLEAPFGNVDYGRFMGGWALTADGKTPAGPLTMDCGHAPMLRADRSVATEHYDNACSVIGHVAVGESRRLGGVWVAGALVPGVRPDQVARALACRCSGDWEPHPDRPGWSELVACLLVPAPGFGSAHPGNRSVTMRDGALVASSAPVHYRPTTEDRQALARAQAVRRLIDGAGRSPADRVMAAIMRAR